MNYRIMDNDSQLKNDYNNWLQRLDGDDLNQRHQLRRSKVVSHQQLVEDCWVKSGRPSNSCIVKKTAERRPEYALTLLSGGVIYDNIFSEYEWPYLVARAIVHNNRLYDASRALSLSERTLQDVDDTIIPIIVDLDWEDTRALSTKDLEQFASQVLIPAMRSCLPNSPLLSEKSNPVPMLQITACMTANTKNVLVPNTKKRMVWWCNECHRTIPCSTVHGKCVIEGCDGEKCQREHFIQCLHCSPKLEWNFKESVIAADPKKSGIVTVLARMSLMPAELSVKKIPVKCAIVSAMTPTIGEHCLLLPTLRSSLVEGHLRKGEFVMDSAETRICSISRYIGRCESCGNDASVYRQNQFLCRTCGDETCDCRICNNSRRIARDAPYTLLTCKNEHLERDFSWVYTVGSSTMFVKGQQPDLKDSSWSTTAKHNVVFKGSDLKCVAHGGRIHSIEYIYSTPKSKIHSVGLPLIFLNPDRTMTIEIAKNTPPTLFALSNVVKAAYKSITFTFQVTHNDTDQVHGTVRFSGIIPAIKPGSFVNMGGLNHTFKRFDDGNRLIFWTKHNCFAGECDVLEYYHANSRPIRVGDSINSTFIRNPPTIKTMLKTGAHFRINNNMADYRFTVPPRPSPPVGASVYDRYMTLVGVVISPLVIRILPSPYPGSRYHYCKGESSPLTKSEMRQRERDQTYTRLGYPFEDAVGEDVKFITCTDAGIMCDHYFSANGVYKSNMIAGGPFLRASQVRKIREQMIQICIDEKVFGCGNYLKWADAIDEAVLMSPCMRVIGTVKMRKCGICHGRSEMSKFCKFFGSEGCQGSGKVKDNRIYDLVSIMSQHGQSYRQLTRDLQYFRRTVDEEKVLRLSQLIKMSSIRIRSIDTEHKVTCASFELDTDGNHRTCSCIIGQSYERHIVTLSRFEAPEGLPSTSYSGSKIDHNYMLHEHVPKSKKCRVVTTELSCTSTCFNSKIKRANGFKKEIYGYSSTERGNRLASLLQEFLRSLHAKWSTYLQIQKITQINPTNKKQQKKYWISTNAQFCIGVQRHHNSSTIWFQITNIRGNTYIEHFCWSRKDACKRKCHKKFRIDATRQKDLHNCLYGHGNPNSVTEPLECWRGSDGAVKEEEITIDKRRKIHLRNLGSINQAFTMEWTASTPEDILMKLTRERKRKCSHGIDGVILHRNDYKKSIMALEREKLKLQTNVKSHKRRCLRLLFLKIEDDFELRLEYEHHAVLHREFHAAQCISTLPEINRGPRTLRVLRDMAGYGMTPSARPIYSFCDTLPHFPQSDIYEALGLYTEDMIGMWISQQDPMRQLYSPTLSLKKRTGTTLQLCNYISRESPYIMKANPQTGVGQAVQIENIQLKYAFDDFMNRSNVRDLKLYPKSTPGDAASLWNIVDCAKPMAGIVQDIFIKGPSCYNWHRLEHPVAYIRIIDLGKIIDLWKLTSSTFTLGQGGILKVHRLEDDLGPWREIVISDDSTNEVRCIVPDSHIKKEKDTCELSWSGFGKGNKRKTSRTTCRYGMCTYSQRYMAILRVRDPPVCKSSTVTCSHDKHEWKKTCFDCSPFNVFDIAYALSITSNPVGRRIYNDAQHNIECGRHIDDRRTINDSEGKDLQHVPGYCKKYEDKVQCNHECDNMNTLPVGDLRSLTWKFRLHVAGENQNVCSRSKPSVGDEAIQVSGLKIIASGTVQGFASNGEYNVQYDAHVTKQSREKFMSRDEYVWMRRKVLAIRKLAITEYVSRSPYRDRPTESQCFIFISKLGFDMMKRTQIDADVGNCEIPEMRGVLHDAASQLRNYKDILRFVNSSGTAITASDLRIQFQPPAVNYMLAMGILQERLLIQ